MSILTNGHSTTLLFPSNPALFGTLFKEVTVKPPGWDSLGPIDTTSMRNTALRTKIPKNLTDITAATLTVQYDPTVITPLNLPAGIMRVNQLVYLIFPNGVRWGFYGWMDKFDPNEHSVDELPLANMTIEVSNINPNNRLETKPFLV